VALLDDTAEWLLPAEAYWSAAWYAREQERLFARCWDFVGTLEDLAGGAVVTTAVGASTTVWLDADGVPRCSRGSIDHWCGLVFAHADPDAPALADWLGDLPDRIGGFRPDRLVEVARHRFRLGANWKFFVENHVDVYHLWYLHGASLGAYDHNRAEWGNSGPPPDSDRSFGPHWVFYEPPRDGVDTDAEEFWRGLLPVTHVGRERWGSGAHLIFPNLTFATGAGFFMTYQCSPTGPDSSVVDMGVRAEPGSDAAPMLTLSKGIIEREDGSACEALQAAVRSPWFSVGPMARRHELPITRFHRTVLEYLR
jgi:phenylpropionate dioxygenase-like ring-hydroxylating dioxygenase large terminal subunit